LASHREVLGEEIWRLTQGWVDGIGTFHEVAEPRQVGLDLACGGGLAQGSLCLKQEAVVAAKENRRVGQPGHSQFPDELLTCKRSYNNWEKCPRWQTLHGVE